MYEHNIFPFLRSNTPPMPITCNLSFVLTLSSFISLAREAGLSVVKERKANEIPEGLHDVYTYVLS